MSETESTTSEDQPTQVHAHLRTKPWSRRAWSRIVVLAGQATTARGFVGILGTAGIVFGAIISWRSSSATTILIVSAALLVFALLGFNWDKLRASWRDVTVELARAARRELEEVAGIEGLPEEAQGPLTSAGAQLQAIEATSSRKSVRAPAYRFLNEPPTEGPGQIEPYHEFRSVGDALVSVDLMVKLPEAPKGVGCIVIAPGGTKYTSGTRRKRITGQTLPGDPPTFMTRFPDDFEPADGTVSAGPHNVEWRQLAENPPGVFTNQVVWTISQQYMPLIASDFFVVP